MRDGSRFDIELDDDAQMTRADWLWVGVMFALAGAALLAYGLFL